MMCDRSMVITKLQPGGKTADEMMSECLSFVMRVICMNIFPQVYLLDFLMDTLSVNMPTMCLSKKRQHVKIF